jgi:hypothetical protein
MLDTFHYGTRNPLLSFVTRMFGNGISFCRTLHNARSPVFVSAFSVSSHKKLPIISNKFPNVKQTNPLSCLLTTLLGMQGISG